MSSLLIAVDHALVRDSLNQLLGLFADIDVSVEVADEGRFSLLYGNGRLNSVMQHTITRKSC